MMDIFALLFCVLTSLYFVRKMSLAVKFLYFFIFKQNNYILALLTLQEDQNYPKSTDYENSGVQ